MMMHFDNIVHYLFLIVLGITVLKAEIYGSLRNKCEKDGIFPDISDCSRFYMCSAGKKTIFQCPAQLRFNPDILVCDWPINVICMKDKITEKPSLDPRFAETTIRVITDTGSKTEHVVTTTPATLTSEYTEDFFYDHSITDSVRDELTSNDVTTPEGTTAASYTRTSSTPIQTEVTEETTTTEDITKDAEYSTTDETTKLKQQITSQDESSDKKLIPNSTVNAKHFVTHTTEAVVHTSDNVITGAEATTDVFWVQNSEETTTESITLAEQITLIENIEKEDIRSDTDYTIPDYMNERVSESTNKNSKTETLSEESTIGRGIDVDHEKDKRFFEDLVSTNKPIIRDIEDELNTLVTKDNFTSQFLPLTTISSLLRNEVSLKHSSGEYQEHIVNANPMNQEGKELGILVKGEAYLDTTHNTVPPKDKITQQISVLSVDQKNSEKQSNLIENLSEGETDSTVIMVTEKIDSLVDGEIVPELSSSDGDSVTNSGESDARDGVSGDTDALAVLKANDKEVISAKQEKAETDKNGSAADSENVKTLENIVIVEDTAIDDGTSAVAGKSGKAVNSRNEEAVSMMKDTSTIIDKTTQQASVLSVDQKNSETKSNLIENVTERKADSKVTMATEEIDSLVGGEIAQELSSSDGDIVTNSGEPDARDGASGDTDALAVLKANDKEEVIDAKQEKAETGKNGSAAENIVIVEDTAIDDDTSAVAEKSGRVVNSGNEEAVSMMKDTSTIIDKTTQQASVLSIDQKNSKTKSNLIETVNERKADSKMIMAAEEIDSLVAEEIAQELSSSDGDIVTNSGESDARDGASKDTDALAVFKANDKGEVIGAKQEKAKTDKHESAADSGNVKILENIVIVEDTAIDVDTSAVAGKSDRAANSHNEEAVSMTKDSSTVIDKTAQQASVLSVDQKNSETNSNLTENVNEGETDSKVIMVAEKIDSLVAGEIVQELSPSDGGLATNSGESDARDGISGDTYASAAIEAIDKEEVINAKQKKAETDKNGSAADSDNVKTLENIFIVEDTAIDDGISAVAGKSGEAVKSGNEEAVNMTKDTSTIIDKTTQQASVLSVDQKNSETKPNLIENVYEREADSKMIMVTEEIDSLVAGEVAQELSSSDGDIVTNLGELDARDGAIEDTDALAVLRANCKEEVIGAKQEKAETDKHESAADSQNVKILENTVIVEDTAIDDDTSAVAGKSGKAVNSSNEEAVKMTKDTSTVIDNTTQQASVLSVNQKNSKTKSNLIENVNERESDSKMIMVTEDIDSLVAGEIAQELSSFDGDIVSNMGESDARDGASGDTDALAVSKANDIEEVIGGKQKKAETDKHESAADSENVKILENIVIVEDTAIEYDTSAVAGKSGKAVNSGKEEAVSMMKDTSTVIDKTTQQASVLSVDQKNSKTKLNVTENVNEVETDSKLIMVTEQIDSLVAGEIARELSSSDGHLVSNTGESDARDSASEDTDALAVQAANHKEEVVGADSFITKGGYIARDRMMISNTAEKVDPVVTKKGNSKLTEEISEKVSVPDIKQMVDQRNSNDVGGMKETVAIIDIQNSTKEGRVTNNDAEYSSINKTTTLLERTTSQYETGNKKRVPKPLVNEEHFVSHGEENVIHTDTDITKTEANEITPSTKDNIWIQNGGKISYGGDTELDILVEKKTYMDTSHNTVPAEDYITEKLMQPTITTYEEGLTEDAPYDEKYSVKITEAIEQAKWKTDKDESGVNSKNFNTLEDIVVLHDTVINDNASAIQEKSGKAENPKNDEVAIMNSDISTDTERAYVLSVEQGSNKTEYEMMEGVSENISYLKMGTVTNEIDSKEPFTVVKLATNKEESHAMEDASQDTNALGLLEANARKEVVLADTFVANSDSVVEGSLKLSNISEKVDPVVASEGNSTAIVGISEELSVPKFQDVDKDKANDVVGITGNKLIIDIENFTEEEEVGGLKRLPSKDEQNGVDSSLYLISFDNTVIVSKEGMELDTPIEVEVKCRNTTYNKVPCGDVVTEKPIKTAHEIYVSQKIKNISEIEKSTVELTEAAPTDVSLNTTYIVEQVKVETSRVELQSATSVEIPEDKVVNEKAISEERNKTQNLESEEAVTKKNIAIIIDKKESNVSEGAREDRGASTVADVIEKQDAMVDSFIVSNDYAKEKPLITKDFDSTVTGKIVKELPASYVIQKTDANTLTATSKSEETIGGLDSTKKGTVEEAVALMSKEEPDDDWKVITVRERGEMVDELESFHGNNDAVEGGFIKIESVIPDYVHEEAVSIIIEDVLTTASSSGDKAKSSGVEKNGYIEPANEANSAEAKPSIEVNKDLLRFAEIEETESSKGTIFGANKAEQSPEATVSVKNNVTTSVKGIAISENGNIQQITKEAKLNKSLASTEGSASYTTISNDKTAIDEKHILIEPTFSKDEADLEETFFGDVSVDTRYINNNDKFSPQEITAEVHKESAINSKEYNSVKMFNNDIANKNLVENTKKEERNQGPTNKGDIKEMIFASSDSESIKDLHLEASSVVQENRKLGIIKTVEDNSEVKCTLKEAAAVIINTNKGQRDDDTYNRNPILDSNYANPSTADIERKSTTPDKSGSLNNKHYQKAAANTTEIFGSQAAKSKVANQISSTSIPDNVIMSSKNDSSGQPTGSSVTTSETNDIVSDGIEGTKTIDAETRRQNDEANTMAVRENKNIISQSKHLKDMVSAIGLDRFGTRGESFIVDREIPAAFQISDTMRVVQTTEQAASDKFPPKALTAGEFEVTRIKTLGLTENKNSAYASKIHIAEKVDSTEKLTSIIDRGSLSNDKKIEAVVTDREVADINTKKPAIFMSHSPTNGELSNAINRRGSMAQPDTVTDSQGKDTLNNSANEKDTTGALNTGKTETAVDEESLAIVNESDNITIRLAAVTNNQEKEYVSVSSRPIHSNNSKDISLMNSGVVVSTNELDKDAIRITTSDATIMISDANRTKTFNSTSENSKTVINAKPIAIDRTSTISATNDDISRNIGNQYSRLMNPGSVTAISSTNAVSNRNENGNERYTQADMPISKVTNVPDDEYGQRDQSNIGSKNHTMQENQPLRGDAGSKSDATILLSTLKPPDTTLTWKDILDKWDVLNSKERKKIKHQMKKTLSKGEFKKKKHELKKLLKERKQKITSSSGENDESSNSSESSEEGPPKKKADEKKNKIQNRKKDESDNSTPKDEKLSTGKNSFKKSTEKGNKKKAKKPKKKEDSSGEAIESSEYQTNFEESDSTEIKENTEDEKRLKKLEISSREDDDTKSTESYKSYANQTSSNGNSLKSNSSEKKSKKQKSKHDKKKSKNSGEYEKDSEDKALKTDKKSSDKRRDKKRNKRENTSDTEDENSDEYEDRYIKISLRNGVSVADSDKETKLLNNNTGEDKAGKSRFRRRSRNNTRNRRKSRKDSK